MTVLYIEEYPDPEVTGRRVSLDVMNLPLAVHRVSILGNSTESATFQSTSRYARLVAATACQFELGATPTAGVNSRYLPPDDEVFITITAGEKLAVIEPGANENSSTLLTPTASATGTAL